MAQRHRPLTRHLAVALATSALAGAALVGLGSGIAQAQHYDQGTNGTFSCQANCNNDLYGGSARHVTDPVTDWSVDVSKSGNPSSPAGTKVRVGDTVHYDGHLDGRVYAEDGTANLPTMLPLAVNVTVPPGLKIKQISMGYGGDGPFTPLQNVVLNGPEVGAAGEWAIQVGADLTMRWETTQHSVSGTFHRWHVSPAFNVTFEVADPEPSYHLTGPLLTLAPAQTGGTIVYYDSSLAWDLPLDNTPPPTKPDVVPFTTADDLVARQYSDFTHKAATAAQLATDAGAINTFAKDSDTVIESIANHAPELAATSPEGSLIRLYEAYFQRLPDLGGYRYWLAELHKGLGLDGTSQKFTMVPEFAHKYGTLTDRQFVDTILYHNILERSPDKGGEQHWVDALHARTTRGRIVTLTSEAHENILLKADAVKLWFIELDMLRRATTAVEANAWLPGLHSGAIKYHDLIANIRHTAEYRKVITGK